MAGLVEKTYGDALFELIIEEDPSKLSAAKEELSQVAAVISDVPELIKLSKTPTIEKQEKLGLIESTFRDRLSGYVYNFLMVLTDAGRLDYFSKRSGYFSERCNEYLGIAEITVVTCQPLTAKAKAELSAKMEKVLGKKIVMKEEIDTSIIGGIVVRNGNTTLDGSVRARLNALRSEIGSVIC